MRLSEFAGDNPDRSRDLYANVVTALSLMQNQIIDKKLKLFSLIHSIIIVKKLLILFQISNLLISKIENVSQKILIFQNC